jgi:hypothetical protein
VPTTRRRRIHCNVWTKAAIALVSLLAIGVFWIAYELAHVRDRWDARARERTRDEVAKVKSGLGDTILLSNELGDGALDEFARAMDDLKGVDHFSVHISYSHSVDRFLEQIRGLRGVRSLQIYKTDLTDAGMDPLATLPDLESLGLYHVRITDAGLKELASCPKLSTLGIDPREPVTITISTLVALPHLQTLTLYDTYPNSWIEPRLNDLEQATNLKELTLVYISAAKVEAIRAKLPNCVITVNESGK